MSKPENKTQEANLGAVVGDSRKVTLPSGREVNIHLCKVRHVGRVAKIIAGIVTVVTEAQGSSGGLAGVDFGKAIQDNTLLLRLFSQVADDIYVLVSLLSDVPYEEVLNFGLDDALVILSEILKDNYRFFMDRVVPLLPAILPTQTTT